MAGGGILPAIIPALHILVVAAATAVAAAVVAWAWTPVAGGKVPCTPAARHNFPCLPWP